jgi:hypothetical protein
MPASDLANFASYGLSMTMSSSNQQLNKSKDFGFQMKMFAHHQQPSLIVPNITDQIERQISRTHSASNEA